MPRAFSEATLARVAWPAIGRVAAAHAVALREADVFEADALHALLVGVEAVARAEPPEGALATLVARFDERLDALLRPELVGTGALGRATNDVAATVGRLVLRDAVLEVAEAEAAARRAALELAGAHAVTLMPAYSGGQPAQPTTFGHFLGGLIGPLGRAAGRLRAAYADLDLSPMGAASLAASAVVVDRERVAALLGFQGVLANTFDAVAAIDHLLGCLDTVGLLATSLRRFLGELLLWLRTEPAAFRLPAEWGGADPSLPQLAPAVGLARLHDDARAIEAAAAAVHRLVAEQPYAPVTADDPLGGGLQLLEDLAALLRSTERLLGALEVNRAYLANRAGRGFTTATDLAFFLMSEEGLEPAAAHRIAALTIARAMGEGLEISALRPEMLDVAAMMTLGRELKVEFEALGRYLAPRRFVERRSLPGGPAPLGTRAYLDGERGRLNADLAWRRATRERIDAARAELYRLIEEAVAGEGA